tara:strand:- start:604 stop:927 length:324 start_codon:yes stop_codon:yes gene_type:complete
MPNTPKKFKGFSKLPEAVQQKMDPNAAMKYMEGGAVNKPKASMYMNGGKVMNYNYGGEVNAPSSEVGGVMYEGSPKIKSASTKGGTGSGNSRGGGAALRGTKFSGVK